MTWIAEHDDPSEPTIGSYLVYGLQLLQCKVPKPDFLPCAKEALKSWEQLRPGNMQLPVPEEIIYDIGLHIGQERLDVLLLMLVQFDACLRPSEALMLRKEHLVRPMGARYISSGD